MVSGEESKREKEDDLSLLDRGLSSSSHVVGRQDSISPTDGRRMPVFGSLVDALDGQGATRVRRGSAMIALESELTNSRRGELLFVIVVASRLSSVHSLLLCFGEGIS